MLLTYLSVYVDFQSVHGIVNAVLVKILLTVIDDVY